MLKEERVELLSQRSRSSIRTDRTSTSKSSQRTSSSMRTAAEAAALQVKMNSLKRLVGSVGRVPDLRAGGRGFKARPDQHSGSLNN